MLELNADLSTKHSISSSGALSGPVWGIKSSPCDQGAPWVIKRGDVEGRHLVLRAKMDRKARASSDPDQRTLVFQ